MKYKEHIINYAIDNNVSLEEAYRRFVVQGEKAPEPEPEPEMDDDGELQEFPPGYDDEVMTPEEGKAWARYQQIQKELARLYEEYATAGEDYIKNHTEEITKADMDWVDGQLRQIDNIE
tara:strand:+ start:132 stop:488 length:357 start_codon:yes stop_codon:yes gene_type:complete